MKKVNLALGLLLVPFIGISQSTTPTNNQNPTLQNRYLGFDNNFPLFTKTAGVTRTRLNGNWATTINGVPGHNVTGYFGIGPNGYFNTNSPWAMLHLEGGNNVPQFGGAGWRTWMGTGVFIKENSDAMYVGLKPEDGTNRSDAIINWSDDPTNNGGVDKLRFLFTAATGTGNGSGSNPLNGLSFEGYEFMRMQAVPTLINSAGYPVGHIGIGPLFQSLIPQSRLHIHAEDNLATFIQLSTQNGTGGSMNDGLRLGVDLASGQTNGYLRWQENTPFIVQTDWDATSGGIQQGERMRVTTISQTGGVPQPTNVLDGNITRVAISHRGSQPITQPRSLLHLGYNTGTSTFNLPDGWRSWMDIGTYTGAGTDNMYVGLKQEQGDPLFGNRFDAVINWGDDPQFVSQQYPSGPDALRFIFTANVNNSNANSEAISQNGLDVARMIPEQASTMPNDNAGMVGIGDWSPANNPNNPPIDAKLDIDGDLRIRTVTQKDNLTQFLVIDPNDENRVHWRTIPTGTGGGSGGAVNNAHNGTSMSTSAPDHVALGQNLNQVGDPGQLISTREIPMNNYNVVFTDNAANTGSNNRVGIGTDGPLARLHVKVNDNIQQFSPIGLRVDNNQTSTVSGIPNIGIVGSVIGDNNQNLGMSLTVSNAVNNTGVSAIALDGTPGENRTVGGGFEGKEGKHNRGVGGTVYVSQTYTGSDNAAVQGTAFNAETNRAGYFRAIVDPGKQTKYNYGVYAETTGESQNFAVAVYGRTMNDVSQNKYAGYFDGDVYINGVNCGTGWAQTSDQQFKTDVADITDALDIINQLHPRSYNYDTLGFPQFNFSSNGQYGFIAQEIETILPELVSQKTQMAELDTSGNVINPEVTFKTLNYNAFIAILAKGLQEQQSQLDSVYNINDSLETVVTDLNDRLTQLENCLSNILPALCNANNQAVEQTPEEMQTRMQSILDVELRDGEHIVLNQNVPNPFAERTVITYSIPHTVQKAQIHFYDGTGALINTVDITERGNGQLNVFANDLSSGVYVYSLVADGKVVATKRMMKE